MRTTTAALHPATGDKDDMDTKLPAALTHKANIKLHASPTAKDIITKLSPSSLTTAKAAKRRVRFGTASQIIFDASMTREEKDHCFHNPDDLKERTKQEIQLARRCFRTHSKLPAHFVIRGLEKRLQSTVAQKRKWYSFLQSFLALQHDLKKLEGDVSNLLAVFVSTHSKTDQATAYQMARQDQATAFAIYDQEGGVTLQGCNGTATAMSSRLQLRSTSSGDLNSSGKLKHSNSKSNLRAAGGTQKGCHLARSA